MKVSVEQKKSLPEFRGIFLALFLLLNTTLVHAGEVVYWIEGGDDDLFSVTFAYRPATGDPITVMVTGLTVTGGGVAQEPLVIKAGAILRKDKNYTQVFKRTMPKTDIAIRVDFQDNPGIEILINGSDGAGSQNALPVGAIVSSILGWPKHALATKDSLVFDATVNQWAPCDGRDVTGSELARLTQRAKQIVRAPDLRGVFLRGLNRFDPDEPASEAVSEQQRDPGEKGKPIREKAGIFQAGNVGSHQHTFYGGGARDDVGGKKGNDLEHLWDGHDWRQDDRRTTKGGPTGETRPNNISVFYYIKIN